MRRSRKEEVLEDNQRNWKAGFPLGEGGRKKERKEVKV